MSSRIWTPPAVGSEAAPLCQDAWRAVEAQHVVSTRALVDTLDEQHVLERVLDDGKPPIPASAAHLHYLLFTPFRYAPPTGGSRFRGPVDPGVFYAADAVRTACAELGYWRWRHLLESPALESMPTKPQTVFRVRLATTAIDLREPPFVRDRKTWTDPDDYRGCQRLGTTAREAGVGAIRYESVRDPRRGGCCAVLAPRAFARPSPLEQQTWMLSVARDRVVWQRTHVVAAEEHEFPAEIWGRRA
ncbi:MAG TPA: RES family NAD+ phosphorylase [Casimicrobiaceae bacterium]|nr:RES family NAD+ phosphorylase [Casimicrobiaceae bacterium]